MKLADKQTANEAAHLARDLKSDEEGAADTAAKVQPAPVDDDASRRGVQR
jgi:hypothetical protein